ncbi:MAG: hypothetical protein K2K35_02650, partial [Lachnospiraceae bacterium]|nr:hypothetical protein [Lachnospiraceae bacterium]
VITGTGNGSAKVYAYYPASGLTTSVNVTVKGASSGSGSSGGSSGGGIAATPTPAPAQTPEPVQTQTPEPGQGNEPGSEVPEDSTETENPGQDNGETEATKKIQTGKSSVIVKAGSTAKVKFKTTVADNAVRAAAVKVSVSGNKKVTARIKGQEVVIKAAAKAVKGSKATVTLKSTNAAGKTISAKIKVFVKNSTKKLKAAGSKTFIVKKGSKKQLVLGITAENKNKASTDQIKISSKLAVLKKATIKKGKAVLVLKGKKKGKGTLTVKAGNRKVKIKIRVK